jgi:hypothetical protein
VRLVTVARSVSVKLDPRMDVNREIPGGAATMCSVSAAIVSDASGSSVMWIVPSAVSTSRSSSGMRGAGRSVAKTTTGR